MSAKPDAPRTSRSGRSRRRSSPQAVGRDRPSRLALARATTSARLPAGWPLTASPRQTAQREHVQAEGPQAR